MSARRVDLAGMHRLAPDTHNPHARLHHAWVTKFSDYQWGVFKVRLFLSAAATLAALTSTTMAFEFNVDADTLISSRQTLTVRDLATGEVGIVSYPDFCVKEGKILATGMLALEEDAGKYTSVVYRFKKLPGGAFVVTMATTESAKEPLQYWVANTALAALIRPCQSALGEFEIREINGTSDLASLLSSAASPTKD